MTKLEIQGPDLVVNVLGLDKIWTFKSELRVPLAHIADVGPGAGEHMHGLVWRMPGTAIPGLYMGGTYVSSEGREFWDVAHKEKSIVLTLHDERYNKLVIEVEDRDAAIALVRTAIGRPPAA